MSKYMFDLAWKEIRAAGYLSRKRVELSVAGRGTGDHYEYNWGPNASKNLSFAAEDVSPRKSLAGDLLASGSGPNAILASTLKPGHRLLLAILYGHSDQFGVVSDLGTVDLMRLTGLNENRLKIHLHKLKAHEFLRAVVPGVAGGALLGIPKTTYFLNMGHPELGTHRQSPTVFVNTTPPPNKNGYVFPEGAKWETVGADQIYRAAFDKLGRERVRELSLPFPRVRVGRSKALNISDATSELFIPLSRREVLNHQQHKLEQYASHLLTHYWSHLEADNHPDDVELRKAVLSQFPTKAEGYSEKDSPFEEAVDALLETSFWMAREIQQGMAEFSDVPFEEMSHCVLPRAVSRGVRMCITVLSIPKAEQEIKGGCYILMERPWDKDKETFGDESELPLSNRYYYGLLTNPKAGPKRYQSIKDLQAFERDETMAIADK